MRAFFVTIAATALIAAPSAGAAAPSAEGAGRALDPGVAGLFGVGSGPNPASPVARAAGCSRPRGVVTLVFSSRKYPNIRRHTLSAIRRGWPSILVVNRKGADDRRDRLLGRFRTKRNFDRDEYPPAVGRGVGRGLTRGSGPTGWMASVWYVPSSENRSHGSSLGGKLRRYCDGTRFRYAFS